MIAGWSLRLTIYPGQDGATTLYQDDGISLGHQRGAWQAFRLAWSEGTGKLTFSLAPVSQAWTGARDFVVARHDSDRMTTLTFNGSAASWRM